MWEQIKPENLIEGKEYKFMDGLKFVHIGEFKNGKIINSVTKNTINNLVRIWC